MTMQSNKALLFVNGEPPERYPSNLENYAFIAATDGAYHQWSVLNLNNALLDLKKTSF